jgi:hypothetical protein
VLVLKLDPRGQHLWSKAFGDAAVEQRGESIALTANGEVLVAGVFDGRLDVAADSVLQPASCPADAWCNTSGFVVKLDAAGNALWSRSLGPMRSVRGAATDSGGNVVLSGALPGGVTPFRNSWLTALSAGGPPLWRRAEWPETGIGAGHAVTIDVCGDVLWSVSARSEIESEERAYLAKLSP